MKLEEILPIERIILNVKVENWEEAIRAVGRVMVDTGVVEERYIDGMIKTTKELGAYIVIAPGVAIPHSRPDVEALGQIAEILSDPAKFNQLLEANTVEAVTAILYH